MVRLRRVLAYVWAAPNTLLGIAVALLLFGRFRFHQGVIEVHGPLIAKALSRTLVPAAAMTLGHVVLGQTKSDLERTRRHERVHVRQYERWGLFFLPAYITCSLVLYAMRRDGYRGNPFEIEAYAVDDPSLSKRSDSSVV